MKSRHPKFESLEARRLLATIFVDLNAPTGTNDGTSWSHAYKTLSAALVTATSGDDVRIANGTYKPGTARTDTFAMKAGVDLFGGYAGYGAANPNARDSTGFQTTLSGEIGASGTSDNSFHVVHAKDLASPITLDGLRITAGNAEDVGGGVWLERSSANLNDMLFEANQSESGALRFEGQTYNNRKLFLNITNSRFINNEAYAYGGAIHMLTSNDSPVHIKDTIFDNNSATEIGAAIYDQYDSTNLLEDPNTIVINGCTFKNHASEAEYVVHIRRMGSVIDSIFKDNEQGALRLADGFITDCTFENNHSTGQSENGYAMSAVYLWGGMVYRSTFTGNTSTDRGGALYAASESHVIACTFKGNSAPEGGAVSASGCHIERSIFVGNTSVNGGAISGGDLTISSSVFIGNSATKGGAVYASALRLVNSTFTKNTASEGAALYLGPDDYDRPVDAHNSIFWNNASDSNKDIEVDDSDTGAASVSNSIVQHPNNEVQNGGGNINADPLFIAEPSTGVDNEWGTDDDNPGNLALQSNSPAIDAAPLVSSPDTGDIYPSNADFNNGYRKHGSDVDMGAFERQPELPIQLIDGVLKVDGNSGNNGIELGVGQVAVAEFVWVTMGGAGLHFLIQDVKSIRVDAGAGKDWVRLPDTPDAADIDCYVFGGDGNDLIDGGTGDATISGGAGDDEIRAYEGRTRINGNSGRDSLFGYLNDDRMYGGPGDDSIFGGAGSDKIYGESGNDHLKGGLNVDWLYGGDGDDSLYGQQSNDKLFGEGGNDRLIGNTGADLINGGSGTDAAKNEDDENAYLSIESYF